MKSFDCTRAVSQGRWVSIRADFDWSIASPASRFASRERVSATTATINPTRPRRALISGN